MITGPQKQLHPFAMGEGATGEQRKRSRLPRSDGRGPHFFSRVRGLSRGETVVIRRRWKQDAWLGETASLCRRGGGCAIAGAATITGYLIPSRRRLRKLRRDGFRIITSGSLLTSETGLSLSIANSLSSDDSEPKSRKTNGMYALLAFLGCCARVR